MLNKAIDEVLFDESGRAWGVKAGEEIAKADIIVGDPSYFHSRKTRSAGRVVRSICILDHPIAGMSTSKQIIPFNHNSINLILYLFFNFWG